MKKEEVVIQLHKPNMNEMLFFLTSGMIMSVPLTLFIYQYAASLLVGLDPFTIALISTAFLHLLSKNFRRLILSSTGMVKPNDPLSTLPYWSV